MKQFIGISTFSAVLFFLYLLFQKLL